MSSALDLFQRGEDMSLSAAESAPVTDEYLARLAADERFWRNVEIASAIGLLLVAFLVWRYRHWIAAVVVEMAVSLAAWAVLAARKYAALIRERVDGR